MDFSSSRKLSMLPALMKIFGFESPGNRHQFNEKLTKMVS